jgi:hypothetical protein
MTDPTAIGAVLPIFRIVASEFSATSDSDVEDVVGIVAGSITPSVFGTRAAEAVAQLAAHQLTMSARAEAMSAGSAGVGAVSSIGTGDLSVSFGFASAFASSSHEDDYYRQSSHGLAYLQIRDSRSEIGAGILT